MAVDLVLLDVAAGATNTLRPLTQPTDLTRRRASVDATQAAEEWRWIPGFEGRYQVSDLGRVKSWLNPRWKQGYILVLQKPPNKHGYVSLTLCRLFEDGTTRKGQHPVHRLVLSAFVGPCPDGQETRHLNSVRDDNRLVNLAWGTTAENIEDRRRTGAPWEGAKPMWNR